MEPILLLMFWRLGHQEGLCSFKSCKKICRPDGRIDKIKFDEIDRVPIGL